MNNSEDAAKCSRTKRPDYKMTNPICASSSRKHSQFKSRYTISISLVVALCLVCDVQCQFFTKANSKSIPRMGRRSPADPTTKADAYKRILIDRLVDEFGPDLLLQLARSENQARSSSVDLRAPGGEQYIRNDQPFDINLNSVNDAEQQQALSQEPQQMSRDERGAGDGQSMSRHSYRDNAKSLAMRAFNADRLLRHLAAGGSPMSLIPLSPAYENVIAAKDPRSSM